jgi:hypothetical protein
MNLVSPVLFLSVLAGSLAAQDPDAVRSAVRPTSGVPLLQRDEVQQPAATPSASLDAAVALSVSRTPIHTQEADPVGGAYGIWAAGTKYKVGFAGDMTFVPYLGAAYPHNQPFSWHTTAVRVGNTELLDAQQVAARAQTTYQYRYQFGGITEVYDVREEGLEQSFVIDRRPQGTGDLIVEGRVETGLRADNVGPAHRPIPFFDAEGRNIITYGEAYAVDATGQKVSAETSFEAGTLRIHVNGEWLAKASYPVVVDPLITPTRVDFGTLRESVDLCRDDTGNQKMYVFIRTASATDKDLYAYILADDYSTGSGSQVWNDITTSWSHDQIRVAAADAPQKYCAVFDRLFTGGTSAIRCHIHDSGDLTLQTSVVFLSSNVGTYQDWRPDVGGTLLNSSGDKFLIVSQRDAGATLVNGVNSEIWARTLDISAATAVEGTPFLINAGTTQANADDERPAVNKQAAPTSTTNTTWVVVFQEYNNSLTGDDWDAIARQVNSLGAQSTTTWFPAAATDTVRPRHQLGPVVAGAGGRYMVAFAGGSLSLINFKTGLINGDSVEVERFNWPNNGTLDHFTPTTLWGVHSDRRWRVGDVAYDSNTDSHWAVSSLSDRAYVSAASGYVYIDRLGFQGGELEGAILYAAPTGFSGDVGGMVFDDDHDEMATVWAQNDLAAASTTAGSAHEVYANNFSYPAPVAASVAGIGCSTAVPSWPIYNSQQIGHQFSGVSVSGAPANALHFVLLSFGTQNVPVVNAAVWPGCRLLVQNVGPSFLGVMPLAIGSNVFVQLSLPEFLASDTLYFQDWILDPASSIFYSTQRLNVPIIK